MSLLQRLILIATACLIAAAGVYPPYEGTGSAEGIYLARSWLSGPPQIYDDMSRIAVRQLLAEWTGILLIGGIAWFAASSTRRRHHGLSPSSIADSDLNKESSKTESDEKVTNPNAANRATQYPPSETPLPTNVQNSPQGQVPITQTKVINELTLPSVFENVGAIWNPSAAIALSWPFTPAFGAYLHSRNWRTMGKPEQAKASMRWFYLTILLAIAYVIVTTLPPY